MRRTKRRKKKSAFSIFVRNFIRSIFWVSILAGLCSMSYKATMLYYDTSGAPNDERVTSIIREYFGSDAKVEDISKNLILSQNEEGQIVHILLEIFNKNTKNLDYITIPSDTKFTISHELYQKLCSVGSEVPQIICLEDADNYFKDQTLYQYMVILIEDMLKMDISYYTIISEDQFNWVFVESEIKALEDTEDETVQHYKAYKISESFFNETKNLTDVNSLKNFLREESKEYQSNLSLRQKYEYVQAYLDIQEDYIYIHSVYGVQREGYFDIEVEQSQQLVKEIMENSITYMKTQEEIKQEEKINSIGYNIEILNGSGIDGLAASYEKLFVENGYTIVNIGNYTLGNIIQTKIIVKEEGLGKDLVEFVGTANIEVGALPEGVDIQVLLGIVAQK